MKIQHVPLELKILQCISQNVSTLASGQTVLAIKGTVIKWLFLHRSQKSAYIKKNKKLWLLVMSIFHPPASVFVNLEICWNNFIIASEMAINSPQTDFTQVQFDTFI